jgi:hypothetical protein
MIHAGCQELFTLPFFEEVCGCGCDWSVSENLEREFSSERMKFWLTMGHWRQEVESDQP